MKLKQAENLLTVDISRLSLEQLQRHKVKLIDAWRESRAEYGMKQAVLDGFYVPVLSDYSSFFAPRNMYLEHNLDYSIQKAFEREREILLGETETKEE